MKKFLYQNVLKPILFRFDPEKVHDAFTRIGIFLGGFRFTKWLLRKMYAYEHPILEQELFGIHFRNPVGLSAGFDYNVQLTKVMGDLGFAFMSGGTVTYHPYEGNPRPRLARLPKSRSLLVNKGFKSAGIEKVLKNVSFTQYFPAQVGISIGATNHPNICDPVGQVEDILASFRTLMEHEKRNAFAYFELNISCPNVAGSGVLADPEILDDLLRRTREIIGNRVLFVKFQSEIPWEEARELIAIMIRHKVDAIIIGNLVKKRDNPRFDQEEMEEIEKRKLAGNFSGKPVELVVNPLIGKTYQTFGDKIKIIGVGGIFSAEDAYEKIKQGASLVQLITGMIFEGPQLIGDINRGLVQLLKRDGYTSVSEAVGSKHREKPQF